MLPDKEVTAKKMSHIFKKAKIGHICTWEKHFKFTHGQDVNNYIQKPTFLSEDAGAWGVVGGGGGGKEGGEGAWWTVTTTIEKKWR
jgi:hypothetical protein